MGTKMPPQCNVAHNQLEVKFSPTWRDDASDGDGTYCSDRRSDFGVHGLF